MTTGQHLDGSLGQLSSDISAHGARLRDLIESHGLLSTRVSTAEARLLALEAKPTPAPTPAPIPASDVTIWKAGSAPIAGVLGRHALPDRITKVTGGYQYEVRPTDGEVSGPGGRRAEEFGYHKWREGDEVSIVLKGLEFPQDWNGAHPAGAWAIHLQAAEYGSPHFQLQSYPLSDGVAAVAFMVEDGHKNFLAQWHYRFVGQMDVGLSIRWSQGADGIIAARVGETEFTTYRGPTLSDTSEAYLKWGAYCGGGAARKVIIQDVRWAPGLGRIQELRALP
jgi:hypothetical protein